MKFHSMQAILLGVVSIIIAVIFGLISFGLVSGIINLLIWVYGLYVGLEAYSGNDVTIPLITDYARKYSGYGEKTT
jgi:uncharacterized membrane protein